MQTFSLHTGKQVKLGRKKNPVAFTKRRTLWLHDYIEDGAAPPPASVDYSSKAIASLSQILLNDTEGDCVIAGCFHFLGLVTGNEDGTAVVPTQAEVQNAYTGICGPGDNGCVVTDVLDAFKSPGLTANGKVWKITDYMSVDFTNKLMVMYAIDLFGAVVIGFELPQACSTPRHGTSSHATHQSRADTASRSLVTTPRVASSRRGEPCT